ncbi:MAG: phosphotransferase [Mycobacteriaceae bacterium]|nr:phosphotransferase [Mycobacteriaceae bacterium]
MIPRGPSDITRDWLAAVLCTDAIRGVAVSPVGTGQTGATYRVSVTYAREAGLPESFVVKLAAQDPEVRARVVLGYRSEVEFYHDVAETLRLPTPRCFHCDISESAEDFVLVLSDMAPAVQGDQIAGCTRAEAELAVRALAGLHGPRWCDPAWLDFSATAMPKPGDEAAAAGLGDAAKLAADITVEKLGAAMSAADRSTVVEAASLIAPWLSLEPKRFSLLHGDYRLDNMLFDPDRTRITVVDWQTLAVGLPARDVAYFTATSLIPQLRAQVEKELVDAYHRDLLSYGVTDYDRDTCWRDYRLGLLQAPLISTLGLAFAASTERGDEMVLTMLERGCQAIRELGTLELVGQMRERGDRGRAG